jgi:hypothetical protein
MVPIAGSKQRITKKNRNLIKLALDKFILLD